MSATHVWLRIRPSTATRKFPSTYTLSSPAGGYRYEAGKVYKVTQSVAAYLLKQRLDRDTDSPTIFERFESMEAAQKVLAEEQGLLPNMIGNGLLVTGEAPPPVDPTSTEVEKVETPRRRGERAAKPPRARSARA